ncbi:MAPEG family protein [Paracoccus aurantiacus]|uniref:MAPEG family protein n=1 Tax=Paracoccus aurantiacus TaxID=2599412 RepID=A0A5C6S2N9_9RHOB|nr:MAPEG family protein [Paracoccus aurantiacus]TXB68674.1 MAPEG family protein [Paracoccus aurantiacus]
MTPELTVLALAALLQAFQIGLAAIVMNGDVGARWNAGPRDTQPEFSPLTGRLRRAVNNHFESLAFLTIAVVVVSLSDQNSAFTAAAAWVHLLARVLYIPAYAFGWTPWRSVIWGVGFMAAMAMILAALI